MNNPTTHPENISPIEETSPMTAECEPVLLLSAEQIQASETYQQLNQQYLRLAADFENYRRRIQQEHETLRKYGGESVVKALLGALDNIDRAINSLNPDSDPKMLYKSFQLVLDQLMSSLTQVGVTRMTVSGKPFDPNHHEAVAQQASDSVAEEHILAECQAGYLLHDRVLRPAMVTVSTGSASSGTTSAES